MKQLKESQILSAIRKSEPKKKRVTFFITKQAKNALASWCKKHDVSESSAIEEMIRTVVPAQNFKKGE